VQLTSFPDIGERRILVGHAANLADLVEGAVSPTPHFVLFVAADTTPEPGPELVDIAAQLVRAGAAYICCWGPDCGRFHDAFDEADLLVNGESTDDRFIFTTWHEDEPLEEAAWFALNSTWPAREYEPTTGSVILASVGRSEWASRLNQYIASGAPMLDEA
jgi:hypothetical protein